MGDGRPSTIVCPSAPGTSRSSTVRSERGELNHGCPSALRLIGPM